MTDAFISYSRKDTDFVRRLNNELAKQGRDIWIDWEDIPRGTDFLNEIYQGIESTNTFITIVSRHSLISEYCSYELAHARQCNKRIIPLIREQLEGEAEAFVREAWANLSWAQIAEQNWATIRHLNWLLFDKDEDTHFATEFSALLSTLDTDLPYIKQHTRLYVQALEWQRGSQNPSFLLIGDKITAAEEWLVSSNGKQPQPDPLHHEFIIVSRRTENERAARIEELHRRTRRFQSAALIAGVLVILAIIAVMSAVRAEQGAIAIANDISTQVINANATLTQVAYNVNQAETRLTSLDYVARAQEILQSNGNNETAALIALQGLKLIYSTQADSVLNEAVDGLYTRQIYSNNNTFINSVAVSPDGEFVLTGSGDSANPNQDNIAVLWDAIKGGQIQRFIGHTNSITSVAFSPDGKYILTGSSDYTARLWDRSTGEEIRQFIGHTNWVMAVAFSPGGNYILTGSNDRTARLWDTSTGEEIRQFIGHTLGINSVAFNSNAEYVLTGSGDFTARLWNVATGQEIYQFNEHTLGVNSAVFSPDDTLAITAGADKRIILWDVLTGTALREFTGHNDSILSVTFSPDGKFILSGSKDTKAFLWDLASGAITRQFNGHYSWISSVAFSPDGNFVLTGSYDKTARLWDTFISPRLFTGHNNTTVRGVAFSPNGRYVATVGDDKLLILWDIATGQQVREFIGHSDSVICVAFSPDGNYVLTGSRDKTARLWEVTTGREIRRFAGHIDRIIWVSFSRDGNYILTTSEDHSVLLWDTTTGKRLRMFIGHNNQVSSAAFSADGKYIVTASDDTTVRMWEVATGQEIHQFIGHTDKVTSAVFSPDGKHILTGGYDKTARLWDIESGEEIQKLTGHRDVVRTVNFSPDGKYILTGSFDTTARLWDVATGVTIRQYSGHTRSLRAAVFSSDGKYILTGSDDGTARIWDTNYEDFLTYACTRLFSDLTETELSQFGISNKKELCSPDSHAFPVTTATPDLALDGVLWTPIASPTVTATPSLKQAVIHGTYQGEIEVGGGDSWLYSGSTGEQISIIVSADQPAGIKTTRKERMDRELLDTYIFLYAPDGSLLIMNNNDPTIDRQAVERTNSRIDLTLLWDGTYRIEVRSLADLSGGAYSLTIQSRQISQITPTAS